MALTVLCYLALTVLYVPLGRGEAREGRERRRQQRRQHDPRLFRGGLVFKAHRLSNPVTASLLTAATPARTPPAEPTLLNLTT